MRRLILLTIGWVLTAAGVIVTPLPPPFAFGIFLLAAGLVILTANSKTVRRGVQYVRHHNDWFSRALERLHHPSSPHPVKHMVHRTRPHALHRHKRRRERRQQVARVVPESRSEA